jgi:MFS family permease
MVGAGLALGPPLGGILVGHFSWRWIFLINLPVGIFAQWQLWTRVPRDPPGHRASLSLVAAALWCGALVAVTFALSQGPAHGWGDAHVWPLFVLAAALLALFAWDEARAEHPLLPLDLLRGPLGVATTLTLIVNGLSISVGFHLPLYLEEVLRFDAARSGRWLAVLPLLALVLAPLAGRWSDRIGTRTLSVAGMLLAAVGFAVMSQVGTTPHPGHILGGMALIGAGIGIFTVPNSSAAMCHPSGWAWPRGCRRPCATSASPRARRRWRRSWPRASPRMAAGRSPRARRVGQRTHWPLRWPPATLTW